MSCPDLTTYFGLPIRDGGVPIEAIKARDFWPRWLAIMGDTDADPHGIVPVIFRRRLHQFMRLAAPCAADF